MSLRKGSCGEVTFRIRIQLVARFSKSGPRSGTLLLYPLAPTSFNCSVGSARPMLIDHTRRPVVANVNHENGGRGGWALGGEVGEGGGGPMYLLRAFSQCSYWLLAAGSREEIVLVSRGIIRGCHAFPDKDIAYSVVRAPAVLPCLTKTEYNTQQ